MKTVDLSNACPYPGLRSFTEEESLYFKGRDLQVDQITALLEQNKFLMVTGASGEGKSSLIYAGLIPNARAGFFKARYSNWLVAAFRPERTPLHNMSVSLATQFNQRPSTIETELKRGFSSLIDLYTNSSFFIGEEDDSLMGLSDNEQKDRKRKAANLLVLVDQFEEFFTSSENFINDVPSRDSQTVINLVLETARIAIKRNLPVYVVCTMRSDYIGQCSAFRGLPEYIGFSQFFVPRLKRKDLKQVIEEPAILSGNRITQRLIERLVFDVAEGIDQLPILQHALSQIWLAADHGKEEMDLIHYAIAGGMPADDLPYEDIPRFRNWYSSLPPHHQHFYREAGLNKVIGIHANLLYENACGQYNSLHPDQPISQQESKRIIALAFSCLTKIDNGRAVRNRMSLQEITNIINTPKLTEKVAGEVLNIFREEGNSFIHPFKTSEPSSHELSPATVLDITHESLIRNWNKLDQWAGKEFEFYSTYLDFKKQLDRWVKSGRRNSYLLPLGPLTYFENWYKECKPNIGWIIRYAGETENGEQNAREVLGDMKAFLGKSARKELLARTIVKYGPRKIASAAAIIVMLTLSSFYIYDANKKKNENVIERVRMESFALMKSDEVDVQKKAEFLLTEERFNPGSLIPYLEKLEFRRRMDLAIEVFKQLQIVFQAKNLPIKNQVFDLITRDFAGAESPELREFVLIKSNRFLSLFAMDEYYNPDTRKEEILARLSFGNYQRASEFYRNPNLYRPSLPTELNMSIQIWLTKGNPAPDQIKALLHLISPLEGTEATRSFNTYYPAGSFEFDGREPIDFNGGYHMIASLYAASGDLDHLEWTFNQMLDKKGRNYFEVARLLNNHMNVIGYLYQFGFGAGVPRILHWIASNTNNNSPITVLRNLVIRSGYISHLYPLNFEPAFYRSTRGYVFPNLFYSTRQVFDQEMEDYENEIRKIKDPNERNFSLALNAKRKAMFYHKYWYDRNIPINEQRLDGWLREAVNFYLSIDQNYLNGTESSTTMYNGDGIRTNNVLRKNLLLYPDYRDGWFSWTFHSDYFFKFLQKNDLLKRLYQTGNDLQVLHYWIATAYAWRVSPPPNTYSKAYNLPDSTLKAVVEFIDHHPVGKQFDMNLPALVLANHAFESGNTTIGLDWFHRLDFETLTNSTNSYEYLESIFVRNMMKNLCANLAASGKIDDAKFLAEKFSADHEKVIAYTGMAQKVYRQNASAQAFIFLDSAYTKSLKVDFAKLNPDVDPRPGMILVLSEIGSSSLNQEAINQLLDISENAKFGGILSRVAGVAFEGNYYRAYTSIPSSLTESQDLDCRILILLEECKRQETLRHDKTWKSMDDFNDWGWNYVNYLPQ
jgi:hypothetical protein